MSTPLGQLSACSYRVVRPVLPIDRYLGRLGEPFIHFFLEGEELLDARVLLHTLEMRRDGGKCNSSSLTAVQSSMFNDHTRQTVPGFREFS